jgi:prophage regulatory protein
MSETNSDSVAGPSRVLAAPVQTGEGGTAGAAATCPFIRVAAVSERTGLSQREVWRRSRSGGTFPRPRKLSQKVTVWVEEEVDAWVRAVIAGKAA